MRTCLILLAVVFAAAGCSKINETRTFTLEAGGFKYLNITAPISQQVIKLAVTSDQPVNVWVVLEKDVPAGQDNFDPETLKDKVVAKEKNTKDATVTATIPGKEAYRVVIGGVAKKSSVTVKINSQ